MFKFLNLVAAVYIYHRKSKKFLGIDGEADGYWSPLIVDDPAKANNFEIRKSGKTAFDKSYRPKKLSEMTEMPISTSVRIFEAGGKDSIGSNVAEVKDTNRLVLYHAAYSGPTNDQLEVKMLSNFTFMITWKGKCMNLNETTKRFSFGACDNIERDAVDFYYKPKEGMSFVRDFNEEENRDVKNPPNDLTNGDLNNKNILTPRADSHNKLANKSSKELKEADEYKEHALSPNSHKSKLDSLHDKKLLRKSKKLHHGDDESDSHFDDDEEDVELGKGCRYSRKHNKYFGCDLKKGDKRESRHFI